MDVVCEVGLLHLPLATTILAPSFIICINSLKVFDRNCKKDLKNSPHFANRHLLFSYNFQKLCIFTFRIPLVNKNGFH